MSTQRSTSININSLLEELAIINSHNRSNLDVSNPSAQGKFRDILFMTNKKGIQQAISIPRKTIEKDYRKHSEKLKSSLELISRNNIISPFIFIPIYYDDKGVTISNKATHNTVVHFSSPYKQLTTAQIKQLICQMILAVEAFHAKNVVHTDIKASNFYVSVIMGNIIIQLADLDDLTEVDKSGKSLYEVDRFVTNEYYSAEMLEITNQCKSKLQITRDIGFKRYNNLNLKAEDCYALIKTIKNFFLSVYYDQFSENDKKFIEEFDTNIQSYNSIEKIKENKFFGNSQVERAQLFMKVEERMIGLNANSKHYSRVPLMNDSAGLLPNHVRDVYIDCKDVLNKINMFDDLFGDDATLYIVKSHLVNTILSRAENIYKNIEEIVSSNNYSEYSILLSQISDAFRAVIRSNVTEPFNKRRMIEILNLPESINGIDIGKDQVKRNVFNRIFDHINLLWNCNSPNYPDKFEKLYVQWSKTIELSDKLLVKESGENVAWEHYKYDTLNAEHCVNFYKELIDLACYELLDNKGNVQQEIINKFSLNSINATQCDLVHHIVGAYCSYIIGVFLCRCSEKPAYATDESQKQLFTLHMRNTSIFHQFMSAYLAMTIKINLGNDSQFLEKKYSYEITSASSLTYLFKHDLLTTESTEEVKYSQLVKTPNQTTQTISGSSLSFLSSLSNQDDLHAELLRKATALCQKTQFAPILEAIQNKEYELALRLSCNACHLILCKHLVENLASLNIDINAKSQSGGETVLDCLINSTGNPVIKKEIEKLLLINGAKTSELLPKMKAI